MIKMTLSQRAGIGLLALLALVLIVGPFGPSSSETASSSEDARDAKRRAKLQTKKARGDYFFQMLRDPATGSIPAGIRARELAHARRMPLAEAVAGKNQATLQWSEAGPHDVGGRTRALAMDVTNPNVLLAGGASGGVWKSTDGGASWTLKSDPSQHLSVNRLAQDPRPGHTDTWYYTSGEYSGSAGDQGGRASFFGSGLYKSTDGGERWQRIQGGGDDATALDSPYDYLSKVVVHPVTGTVFVTSNVFGLLRSTDGGASFDLVQGGPNHHLWTDLVVTADGRVVAAFSHGFDTPALAPGLYVSADDGVTWTNVTPSDYPDYHERPVLAAAPSDADVVYVLTWTGNGSGVDEDVRFHRLDLGAGTAEDRTANLPNFNEPVGYVDTQGGYNMVMAVKPDDADFVLFGTTNLWRSADGFATPADDADANWIGGYATSNDISQYDNQHPDQQALVFDPTRPGYLLAGHDGGLSRADVTAGTVVWESLNNGYNVTQYYTVAVAETAGDARILGGTQDNGSPYFRFDGQTTSASFDASTGDGSYAYLGRDYAYTSTQNGSVVRYAYGANGALDPDDVWTTATPADASGMLFINPFVVNPVDEDVMVYPAGDLLWRNDALSAIPDYEQEPTASGWTRLDALQAPDGYTFSTLSFSTAPAHVLYYGASHDDQAPRIYRLNDAHTATDGAVDVSIPGAAAGAYVHHIAVNPEDADELLVVFSNYNVTGLYHSTDGGQTYTAVEGNLEGDAATPGPSLRSAAILPSGGGTRYLVATSTGVYGTATLSGGATTWAQEGAQALGNTVVNYLVARPSDGKVFAATHGRGIFVGTADATVDVDDAETPTGYVLAQNYPNPFNPSTTVAFTLPQASIASVKVYDVQGRLVASLVEGTLGAGRHTVPFDATALASGAYVYRLEATPLGGGASVTQTRQMRLVK